MADIDFTFTKVPNSYSARLQRRAVLNPLCRYNNRPASIIAAVERLQQAWRSRLSVLKRVSSWMPGNDEMTCQYARNCAPVFALARPRTRACRINHLCPFCYARWIEQVWHRIDDLLLGQPRPDDGSLVSLTADEITDEIPPPTEAVGDGQNRAYRTIQLAEDGDPVERERDYQHHLLFTSYTRDYPHHTGVEELLKQCMTSQAEAVRAVGSLGCVAAGSLVSGMVDTPPMPPWVFKHRAVHVIRADADVPAPAGVPDMDVERVTQPSRRNVVAALGSCFSYPAELLRGDAIMTAMMLRARAGKRLTTTYGVLRKQHTKL